MSGHEGAWVPPDGYRLCGHGTCGEPVTKSPTKNVAEWQCDESKQCKPEDAHPEHKCACHLVLVRPRTQHVEVLAKPGQTWKYEQLPPGWYTACLCLYEDKDATAPPQPKWDLVAPDGYELSVGCGDCGRPAYDEKNRTWSCINLDANADPGCYLVEVPRDSKQIHILAGPGHSRDIHESHLHNNYDVFCICLKKRP